jgi:uncharacterized membrane protein YoaK (UPF0700 family)
VRTSAVLFVLSVASGAIDAISFLKFGVFTSAMSGNTVLLGIAIGRGELRLGEAAAIAFAAYFTAAAVSRPICDLLAGTRTPLMILLSLEVLLLAGFVGFGLAQSAGLPQAPVIAFAAMAMGVQATAARLLKTAGVNTVVFTSTLTSIAGAVSEAVARHRPLMWETWRQIVSFACYGGGALAAAFLSRYGMGVAILPLVAAGGALVAEARTSS